jgi:hypothetical protein
MVVISLMAYSMETRAQLWKVDHRVPVIPDTNFTQSK